MGICYLYVSANVEKEGRIYRDARCRVFRLKLHIALWSEDGARVGSRLLYNIGLCAGRNDPLANGTRVGMLRLALSSCYVCLDEWKNPGWDMKRIDLLAMKTRLRRMM